MHLWDTLVGLSCLAVVPTLVPFSCRTELPFYITLVTLGQLQHLLVNRSDFVLWKQLLTTVDGVLFFLVEECARVCEHSYSEMNRIHQT